MQLSGAKRIEQQIKIDCQGGGGVANRGADGQMDRGGTLPASDQQTKWLCWDLGCCSQSRLWEREMSPKAKGKCSTMHS